MVKPLFVLDFWTVIKKLDYPVQKPSIHSGFTLLARDILLLSNLCEAKVSGKNSFKISVKPVFKDAFILTIFF